MLNNLFILITGRTGLFGNAFVPIKLLDRLESKD
jgi:hypothetical protein